MTKLPCEDSPAEIKKRKKIEIDTGEEKPMQGRNKTAKGTAEAYWRANLKLLAALLGIWALTSFGAGIFFASYLNQISLFGVPLGFWFAQQGAIYVFIALIFFYIWAIGRLEARYGVGEE